MADPITMEILNNEVALDEKCWACVDKCYQDENGVCSWCKGIGYRLTDAGISIMGLVKRHNLSANKGE